jgi:hypothetical protein
MEDNMKSLQMEEDMKVSNGNNLIRQTYWKSIEKGKLIMETILYFFSIKDDHKVFGKCKTTSILFRKLVS